MKLETRKIDNSTISDLVALHGRAYLSDHFTNKLSPAQLKRYYLGLAEAGALYSFIMFSDGHPVGFMICGERLNDRVKSFVSENFLDMVWVVIKNPHFIMPKIKAMFTRFSKNSWKSEADVRILSIAVDTTVQGKGYGRHMLETLECRLASNGVKVYGLSVKNENHNAIRFYQRYGFEVELQGESTTYYIKVVR